MTDSRDYHDSGDPRDWIATEFAHLSSRTAPVVGPPGISVAVETVRRRRIRNRAWTAVSATVALVAIVGLLVLPGSRGESPIDRVTPSPSPVRSEVASPEPVQPAGTLPEAPTSPTKSPQCTPFVELAPTSGAKESGGAVDAIVEVYKRPPPARLHIELPDTCAYLRFLVVDTSTQLHP